MSTRAEAPTGRVVNPVGTVRFPEELPVSARRDEIAAALRDHQVVIVSGETGSGKTTQLPKICLSIGRGLGAGGTGLIGHTQPRRLAATSVARRIAQELDTPLGDVVGYKIRFNDKLSRGASVKLMTDGILLAETQSDPLLRAYDTLIIDEAHERSLNIDFLLGYLKQLLPRRRDLKVIVTSATIDAERFAKHFAGPNGDAPVIEVSGRLYPVELRWRPKDNDVDLDDAIVAACDEATSIGEGDVLVFLPGEREIRDCAEALRKHHFGRGTHSRPTEIVPLFSRLSAQDQDRVFKLGNSRRIVLATNVAETSLTVPGIRYVVDAGTARVKRYSYRQKVEQLQVEPISQAAANQRAGRCGRVAAGVCIRLYAQDEFAARPRFTDPEILRSSLAAVILRMKSLKLDDIEQFPFLEPPSGRALADGYTQLQELGALDERSALTPIGSELARLPLDPRIGRMLIAARDSACLTEVTIIAAALSTQDPRERPAAMEAQADQAHRKLDDEKSEFLGILKRWIFFQQLLDEKLSNRRQAEACRQAFLNPVRLREWRDVHSQLHQTIVELGWHYNEAPAAYDALHRALLAGLLGNIGTKAPEDAQYEGARGIRFLVWPGSILARKGGRWIMAAELVETSRLFARTVARIEPEWVEQVGDHLLKRSHGDPHWEKKSGRVVAIERATLHGLTIYQGRRVDFAPIDAVLARELFIREALVAGDWEPRLPGKHFLLHNRALVRDIEQLEHKSRRPDVLVDDELIRAFYDANVPDEVHDARTFEDWYRRASRERPRLLFLERDEVMRHEAAGVTTDQFPRALVFAGVSMTLDYHFEPGSARDGVTLSIPLYALNLVNERRTEWLVPGMLRDKVQALIKSLPQKLRRFCVPVPEYAAGFIERHADVFAPDDDRRPVRGLIESLSEDIRSERSVTPMPADFKLETVAPHLFMHFVLIDQGRQVATGRSLAQLRADHGRQARDQFQRLAEWPVDGTAGQAAPAATSRDASPAQRTPPGGASTRAPLPADLRYTDWTFGELPELLEIDRGGTRLLGYPALVDEQDAVTIEVFDDPEQARNVHRTGLRRLFALQLREPIKVLEKQLPDFTRLSVAYMPLGNQQEFKQMIVDATLERTAMADPLPTDEAAFRTRAGESRSRFMPVANELARLTATILDGWAAVRRKLPMARAFAQAHADLESQLAELVPAGFLTRHPHAQLAHLARYLAAMTARIDKLKGDPKRDADRMAELGPMLQRLARRLAGLKGRRDPRIEEFRWLLEELRVSLFAQELRTPMPVSVKRLEKIWAALQ
ncbi:ATP-dependent RNA helicase HrpA [soil metagenome]